ncbi:RHS repeat domain-containing protein [Fibrella aquatilis]|uniref:RHS repeat protein n=1 Tax=Fibrella aquatilis TaxID=2817059 RepID=A0A939GAH5_9BACT|nr:RHS repeat domain-containing protein [Fibrella aquatilis]MBO0933300.1 RHS repeat protein [Fibrella aquatilis]
MLAEVTRPDGQTVQFGYDALGRRVSKTFRGKTTRWVWDGDKPLHEWTYERNRLIRKYCR